MKSSLCRSGKRCLNRLLDNRSTLFSHHHHHQYASTETTNSIANQFSRTYARSPLLLRNFIIRRQHKFPRIAHSYSSSSSSKNGFIGWYLRMLESRPILTKSVSSSLIYIFADLSSQMEWKMFTQKWRTDAQQGHHSDVFRFFDMIRTLRMGGYGLLVMGPALHFWFNFVSRIIPKRDVLNTMKKLFLGQAVFGPIMTTIFFSVNAAVQGENGAEIVARLKRDLLPTLLSGLMYWPICDFVTFKFIPVRLQPLVSNSFSYMWTIYITYMAALEKADSSSMSAIKSVA